MPIKVQCSCGRGLVAREEMVGKKVRCPGCKAILTVEAQEAAGPAKVRAGAPPLPPPIPARRPPEDKVRVAAPPLAKPGKQVSKKAEADDEDEEEEQQPKSRKVQQRIRGLSLANSGLLLHLICWGLVLAIVLVSLLTYGVVGLGMAAGQGAQGVMGVLAGLSFMSLILGILAIPSPLVYIVGCILCLWVPPNSDGRKPMIVSLACMVGGLLIVIITFLVMFLTMATLTTETLFVSGRFGLLGMGIGMIAQLASVVAFFIFLRNMAKYVGEEVQADKANQLLVMFWLVIFGPPLLGYGLIYGLVAMDFMPVDVVIIVAFAIFIGIHIAWARIIFSVVRIIMAVRKAISANIG